MHFLTSLKMRSSRRVLRLGQFKASIAVSLLDVFNTILPTLLCTASKVLLLTSPQQAQTPAQYSNIGLIIEI